MADSPDRAMVMRAAKAVAGTMQVALEPLIKHHKDDPESVFAAQLAATVLQQVHAVGGCTGYLADGLLQHDGPTCPMHEEGG